MHKIDLIHININKTNSPRLFKGEILFKKNDLKKNGTRQVITFNKQKFFTFNFLMI